MRAAAAWDQAPPTTPHLFDNWLSLGSSMSSFHSRLKIFDNLYSNNTAASERVTEGQWV